MFPNVNLIREVLLELLDPSSAVQGWLEPVRRHSPQGEEFEPTHSLMSTKGTPRLRPQPCMNALIRP